MWDVCVCCCVDVCMFVPWGSHLIPADHWWRGAYRGLFSLLVLYVIFSPVKSPQGTMLSICHPMYSNMAELWARLWCCEAAENPPVVFLCRSKSTLVFQQDTSCWCVWIVASFHPSSCMLLCVCFVLAHTNPPEPSVCVWGGCANMCVNGLSPLALNRARVHTLTPSHLLLYMCPPGRDGPSSVCSSSGHSIPPSPCTVYV